MTTQQQHDALTAQNTMEMSPEDSTIWDRLEAAGFNVDWFGEDGTLPYAEGNGGPIRVRLDAKGTRRGFPVRHAISHDNVHLFSANTLLDLMRTRIGFVSIADICGIDVSDL